MSRERIVEQLSELNFKIPSGMSMNDLDGMSGILDRLQALERDKNLSRDDDESREQFIVVLLGEKEIAFRVVDVEGILNVQKITPVPGLPSFILGVCNVRGEITSVVDLQKILGLETRRQKTRRQKATEKMAIVRNNTFSICCTVDAVLDVVRIGEAEVEKIDSKEAMSERLTQFAKGVFIRPDLTGGTQRDEVIIIDTKKLLDSPEMVQYL